MIDIQNQPDFRKIPIDKVGIKGLKYPVKVLDKTTGLQSTVAQISMYVDLPHHCKGTHMSRFVEILHLFRTKVSLESITNILEDMKEILGAQSSHIEITFPYFIEKQAPQTGSKGLMDYTCRLIGASSPGKEPFSGWVAEVRYSTFERGQFDSAADFLMDTKKLKVIQAADRAERAKLVTSLLKVPGVEEVRAFDERPAQDDWLIKPPRVKRQGANQLLSPIQPAPAAIASSAVAAPMRVNQKGTTRRPGGSAANSKPTRYTSITKPASLSWWRAGTAVIWVVCSMSG